MAIFWVAAAVRAAFSKATVCLDSMMGKEGDPQKEDEKGRDAHHGG